MDFLTHFVNHLKRGENFHKSSKNYVKNSDQVEEQIFGNLSEQTD